MVKPRLHVAVIGAGVFGGWTAFYLLRRGTRVTLIDAWGPGNSRASSGGETRIMRGSYGPNQPYTRMAARALRLWKEHEQGWGVKLLHNVGVLWMASAGNDEFERGSLASLHEAGMAYEELSVAEMSRRWPQINFEAVRWGIYEPECGFLMARMACQKLVETFVAEGGEYRIGSVVADGLESGVREGVTLADGSKLSADRYVFACGPWLGKLFPQTIGELIRPTKQDVLFFGTPAGDDRFSEKNMPVWADHRDRFLYGMPASDGRGFKVADDTRGSLFDPTLGERKVSPDFVQSAHEYLAFRFPALRNAPLVESRVCQYENTPDNHFIIDRHPSGGHVWIVGGGSGHGFKHGPALGELVAELVVEEKDGDPVFGLKRFHRTLH